MQTVMGIYPSQGSSVLKDLAMTLASDHWDDSYKDLPAGVMAFLYYCGSPTPRALSMTIDPIEQFILIEQAS